MDVFYGYPSRPLETYPHTLQSTDFELYDGPISLWELEDLAEYTIGVYGFKDASDNWLRTVFSASGRVRFIRRWRTAPFRPQQAFIVFDEPIDHRNMNTHMSSFDLGLTIYKPSATCLKKNYHPPIPLRSISRSPETTSTRQSPHRQSNPGLPISPPPMTRIQPQTFSNYQPNPGSLPSRVTSTTPQPQSSSKRMLDEVVKEKRTEADLTRQPVASSSTSSRPLNRASPPVNNSAIPLFIPSSGEPPTKKLKLAETAVSLPVVTSHAPTRKLEHPPTGGSRSPNTVMAGAGSTGGNQSSKSHSITSTATPVTRGTTVTHPGSGPLTLSAINLSSQKPSSAASSTPTPATTPPVRSMLPAHNTQAPKANDANGNIALASVSVRRAPSDTGMSVLGPSVGPSKQTAGAVESISTTKSSVPTPVLGTPNPELLKFYNKFQEMEKALVASRSSYTKLQAALATLRKERDDYAQMATKYKQELEECRPNALRADEFSKLGSDPQAIAMRIQNEEEGRRLAEQQVMTLQKEITQLQHSRDDAQSAVIRMTEQLTESQLRAEEESKKATEEQKLREQYQAKIDALDPSMVPALWNMVFDLNNIAKRGEEAVARKNTGMEISEEGRSL